MSRRRYTYDHRSRCTFSHDRNYVRKRELPKEDDDWFSSYVRPILRVITPAINAVGTAYGIPGVGTAVQTIGEGGHSLYDSYSRDPEPESRDLGYTWTDDDWVPDEQYEEY